jgi:hypothetical protein
MEMATWRYIAIGDTMVAGSLRRDDGTTVDVDALAGDEAAVGAGKEDVGRSELGGLT